MAYSNPPLVSWKVNKERVCSPDRIRNKVKSNSDMSFYTAKNKCGKMLPDYI